ncbi:MAG: CorA family divalent cation transporter, partial [Candidatus Microthrix parvicella]
TERLYYLLREVLQTQRATSPVRVQVAALMDGDEVPEGAKPYLRDVADHLADVVDRTASARALLSSALEANLTQVSLRQNEDMRKMSAWVSILAVPTMIAGIYGMNFDHMPELDSRFGYPLILGLMASICLMLYRGFRRSGWL